VADEVLFETTGTRYTVRWTGLGEKKERGFRLTLRSDRIELRRTKIVGDESQAIPYHALSRVRVERALVQGRLILQWGLAGLTIGEIPNADLDRLEEIVSERMQVMS